MHLSELTDNEHMEANKVRRNTPSRDADAEVGKRAHMLIWSAGRKQGSVANQLGISPGSFGLKLKGNRGWAIGELIALASVLDTTVAYLVGETEDPHPEGPNGGRAVGPEGLEPPTLSVKDGEFNNVTPLFGRRVA